jgi:methionyl aminopeptidase
MIRLKTSEQIDGIRKSSQLARATLIHCQSLIVPGVTTKELDIAASNFIAIHNGTSACLGYRGFPASICTSVNDVICHGIPNDTPLENGDILKLDVTTILDGYYGDVCDTFSVGSVFKKSKKLIAAGKTCLELGIAQVKPGEHIGKIGFAIGNYARACGYSVVMDYCGHGVGLDFHEDPIVPHSSLANTGPIMQPGMVFTIEPMICEKSPQTVLDHDGWTARTIDGKRSVQWEHTIAVTDSGAEVLTAHP